MDDEGFELHWRAERPRMVRAAFLMAGDLEEAADLVDEVFTSVFARHLSGDIADLRSYLWRSLFNEVKRQLPRRQRVRPSATPDDLISRSNSPEASGRELHAIELRDQIWAAFGDIDDQGRAVLLLRYYADFTNPQVAAHLDLPLGTVKSLVHRNLAAMRQALEPQPEERS